MLELLLVSPKTEKSNGGIAVWTDTFLKNLPDSLNCDLLNIATVGRRAENGNAKRNMLDEFVRTRRIFRNLRAFLKSKKYDVAHINTSCGAFGLIRDYLTARKIKRKQKACKVIVHFHCDVRKHSNSLISVFFLKRLLKIADSCLVLNMKNSVYLSERFNINGIILPNFIEQKVILQSPKKISERIETAVFIGYVQPSKGAREIFELATLLPDIRFALIGELSETVLGWNKPENVVLAGSKPHSEIIEAFDNADVFIFPSHSEGFSIALLESMSRGVPCVATDVGANREMLEDKGGIIVEVGDVNAMKNAFDRINSPDVRKEMSGWLIDKVTCNYTVESVVNELIEIYKR